MLVGGFLSKTDVSMDQNFLPKLRHVALLKDMVNHFRDIKTFFFNLTYLIWIFPPIFLPDVTITVTFATAPASFNDTDWQV